MDLALIRFLRNVGSQFGPIEVLICFGIIALSMLAYALVAG